MGRRHVFVQLSEKEASALSDFVKQAPSNRVRTRAQAVWFSSQGQTVQQITALLSVSERAVWKWFDAYRKGALESLRDKPRRPRKRKLSPQQEEQLVAITRQAPNTVRMSGYTWNCRLLSEWLRKTFHVHLSDEWVRRILLKHNLRFRRPKLSLTSPDPAYAQKKGRLTG